MKRASIWRRLAGLVIDFSLILALGFMIGIVFNLLTQLNTTSSRLVVQGVTTGVTGLFLFLTRDYLFLRKSPGHYLTGTSVVTEAGDSPSNKQLTIRNLPLLFWPIEAVGVLYYGFKKRFGDTWSNTRVILEESSVGVEYAVTRWVIAAVVVFCGFYVSLRVGQLNLTTLPPYEVAVKKIKTDPAVKSAVGEIQSIGWFPHGNVNLNSKLGRAMFSIKVIGEKDTGWVYIRLINRSKHNWTAKILRISSD